MNALERLAKAGKTNSVGTYTFVDADTLRDPKDPKKTYRLQGYDAPEVAGWKNGKWVQGTAGAAEATREITRLAEDQKYNNLVKTGKFDPHGREIVELHDAEGRNFTTELLKSGALDAGQFTKQEDLDAIDVARAFGNNNDAFDDAAVKIQDAIDDQTFRDIRFRQAATNEQAYANGFGTSAVEWRHSDRDLRNNSRNPLSDAWDQGWIGAKEGAFGFLELLGESTDSEYLTDIGKAGVTRARSQQEEYAKVLTDWKDVDGFWSGLEYIQNNAAMSLPYMAITAGSAVAGTLAAPVVGTVGGIGLGITGASTVYSGQIWNEMEGEKNATIAVAGGLAQAALDRLGIGAITGKVPANKLMNAAIEKIMKTNGVSASVAEATLANATKQELGDFLKDGAKIATKQLTAKRSVKQLLKRAAGGALGESATEVMQEAIAYTAAKQGDVDSFNWEELQTRLTAAAIAGGTLGAAFTAPGSINKLAKERAAHGDNVLADETTARQSAIFADQEKKQFGHVASNAENLANINQQINEEGSGLLIEERADEYRTKQRGRTVEEKARDAFNAIPSLWRGATRNIFTDDLLQRSRSARIAADLFGGNPDRIFSGASFEDAKHHRVAQYKNMVSIPQQFYSVMNDGKKFSGADKARISDQVYNSLRNAVNKDGKFDPALVPEGKHRQMIMKLGAELNTLSDKMYSDQKKHNPDLGYIKNYLFKYKTLNKRAVHHNRKGFEKLLVDRYKINPAEAKELTDRITDDVNVGDIDEAFSVVKGGIVPASHKKRSLGLSEDAAFKEFMENDIFANVSHAAKSAARYTAHRDFIGKNGAVVSKLLDNMQKELGDGPEAQAQVAKVASQMQDYLDAESGNYKRPQSEFGKKAQKIQKHAMMLMTFSGLPLATFSSFVEAALIGLSLIHI